MIRSILTVLCLWALLGAFVCQTESPTPPFLSQSPSGKEDGLSRRDLAWNLRQEKTLRLVHSESAASSVYTNLIQSLKKGFPEDWTINIKAESGITADELRNIPLLILGRQFHDPQVQALLKKLPFQLYDDYFTFNGERYDQSDLSFRLFLYPNPDSPTPLFLIGGNSTDAILAQFPKEGPADWGNMFWRSWGYEIYQDKEVIVRGNFQDHTWTFDPDNHFDFSRKTATELQTDHYHFYDLANLGEPFLQQLADDCEKQLHQIVDFCSPDQQLAPIEYFLYPTIEDKGLRLLNTQEGHTVPEQREVHVVVNETFSGQHSLQDILLIIHDLLGEADRVALEQGLAAHFDPRWETRGADFWSARLLNSGNLPPLSELLDNKMFREESPLVMTAAAGSFVNFLIENLGRDEFLSQYREWSPEPDIKALEEGWHHYLSPIDAHPEMYQQRTPPYYRGFNFAHEGYQIYNGYGSSHSAASLAKLGQLGTNAVAIVPYGFQRDAHQAGFLSVHHGAGSENDESVIYAHAQAQQLGMYTLLKPQLWVSSAWPGEVSMPDETAWVDFFEYYYRWIRHYALLAEMRHFDTFCVGVEFSIATRTHPDAWRSMIRRIRGLYSGPITYAANWGEEFEQLAFWDELDFIGLNCYYPLSNGERPSKKELEDAFAKVLKKAEAVSKKFQKPLVFTEVGFRSVDQTWKNPHAEAGDRAYNPECQRLCYEVLFEGIADKEWIKGLFIWKWPSYLDYQKQNPVGFTPYDKPAELVVQNW
ncbi:MAG: hypothetical protein KDD15_33305, partial [Lewinella sp.]|nr:hypothetical protein [Lewinella sp.]